MNKPIHPAVAEHVMRENEKLRGLFAGIRQSIADHWKPTSQRAGEEKHDVVKRIDAALSRQAEPVEPAPAQDEREALALPRKQLERIERRLSDWLELNCCECEFGHSCGRNEVEADRNAIRAALAAQGGRDE